MSNKPLMFLLAALVFSSWTVASVAATDPIVDTCLAASYYPDGKDLFRDCSKAIGLQGLDAIVSAKINLQLGTALYFSHRPGFALNYLDNAVKLAPGLDQAWRRRGWAHFRMGQLSEALLDFTEFLALVPGDPDALFGLSTVRHRQSGDCIAAARDYEQVLVTDPAHYLAKLSLSYAYACNDDNRVRQLEQLDQIVAAGREVVSRTLYYDRNGSEDYDFYAHVRAIRSDIYFDLGRFDDAIAETNWLIETYPGNVSAYKTRAAARLIIKDNAGALADAQFALDQYPNDLDAQKSKTQALTKLHRDFDAITFATDLIIGSTPTPEIAPLYYWRGLAFKATGQRTQAVQDLNMAMTMNRQFLLVIHQAMQQAGYIYGPALIYGHDPDPDLTSLPFANALEACMLDPECAAS